MKEQIIKAMIKDANYDNGSLQSGVFSAFQIACILNKENVFADKIRKELNILKELGFVDLKKFSVDNESNLKCWKWVLTEKGYRYFDLKVGDWVDYQGKEYPVAIVNENCKDV